MHKKLLILTVIIGLLSFGQQAQAGNDNQYRSWNSYGKRQVVSFTQQDKKSIIQYYQRHCKAKNVRKTQDCIYTSSAKKYVVGKPLATNVRVRDLPYRLLDQLETLPAGYEYVKVDSDVLIISAKTGKVMDATTASVNRDASVGSLRPIMNSYVVYFDPQSTVLRRGESRILNQVAREISQYNPSQVTVTSYADSLVVPNSAQPLTDDRAEIIFSLLNEFGMNIQNPSQINPNNTEVVKQLANIARHQAETVSKELLNRNIPSQIVTSKLRGALDNSLMSQDAPETEIAQMVVIDFRR